ncbi:hypothetical protein [Streptomyces sp. NPDC097981]|uniref:hypothetical protein n=1 Tax=Streptomyces sp. NPDC097981 TaxID=3155428 RepID=UPI00332C9BEB
MAPTRPDPEKKEPSQESGWLSRITRVSSTSEAVLKALGALFVCGGAAYGFFVLFQSNPKEVASQVQACEKTHGLNGNYETITTSGKEVLFLSCSWPPSESSDSDGYAKVVRRDVVDLTRDAVSLAPRIGAGPDEADRLTGCRLFNLWYKSSSPPGYFPHMPIQVPADTARSIYGVAYPLDSLGFPPVEGEAYVLHNTAESLDRASCAS